jgi:hypothetical protein
MIIFTYDLFSQVKILHQYDEQAHHLFWIMTYSFQPIHQTRCPWSKVIYMVNEILIIHQDHAIT